MSFVGIRFHIFKDLRFSLLHECKCICYLEEILQQQHQSVVLECHGTSVGCSYDNAVKDTKHITGMSLHPRRISSRALPPQGYESFGCFPCIQACPLTPCMPINSKSLASENVLALQCYKLIAMHRLLLVSLNT